MSLEPGECSIPHIWPWKDEAIDYTLASCLSNVASIRTICTHLWKGQVEPSASSGHYQYQQPPTRYAAIKTTGKHHLNGTRIPERRSVCQVMKATLCLCG